MSIRENVRSLLDEIPEGVIVEAAAKTRTAEEIEEAIEAGIEVIGENYIKDLRNVYWKIGKKAKWHFIGSCSKQRHDLLRNKYLSMIDMVESVDDLEFVYALNKKCLGIGKTLPILIEVNIARESHKSGVFPEHLMEFVKRVSRLEGIKVLGLMTMGPAVEDPEMIRPYFKLARELFEKIGNMELENVLMKYLSMGMSDTYKIAVEEGANIVRIGTKIFGPRKP